MTPFNELVFQQVAVGLVDMIAVVTLNRPEKLNAWTATMEEEFRAALHAAEASPEVRVIVVTGAGRAFCAGADLSPDQGRKEGSAARTDQNISADFGQRYTYLLGITKPILAAINGPAAGVGLCLALFCDPRFMAEGAKLTTAFARRGLIAEHGSSWLLPRLIGTMNALDLLLTGRTIDSDEAERMGLVRVLPSADFLAAVIARAEDLARLSSPRSMRVIKRQVYEALAQSLTDATITADKEQLESFASPDLKEGVAAYRERRPPNFPSE